MTDVIGFVFKPKQLDEDELELYSKWLDAKVVKDLKSWSISCRINSKGDYLMNPDLSIH